MNQSLLIFDGFCNLCNASIDFIIKRDPGKRIQFVPAQTDHGRRVLASMGVEAEDFDSVLLVEDSRVFSGSTAMLRISRHLSGGWRWLVLLSVIPKPIRDWVYYLIARNRSRWFGRRDTCRVPSKDILDRFLGLKD